MKVYLAAAYQSRDRIRLYADELATIGFKCTSSWLAETVDITPGTSGAAVDIGQEQVRRHVLDDFADITNANVLILFTKSATGHQGGGGRHVETGYALAQGKQVIVIGEPENVFHRGAPRCTVVRDWHEAVLELVRLREQNNASRVVPA